MNWDDLHFFLALSRAGTLSAAGKALEVKHSTISMRINAFENSLATRLFDRLAEGYVMTQAGEDLYQHALIMEEQAQAVDRMVFGREIQLQGSLSQLQTFGKMYLVGKATFSNAVNTGKLKAKRAIFLGAATC